ncbi:hypothetical protein DCAR_0206999 [Daucus carota subsp. sativus]|uniref:Uncharacterized protein n=1 Tax=Daucus carota subsp. sativus TaxID=79200 RepID=A0AAF0WG88_DAUCS|nr:PREDICTED: protein TAPETUM DETERMINANT 1-like [Daucus carota subsp. sativus]WOG87768.1 hypothetical protein DCAR_0206999 [Daucus carota subsp. sativus]
MTNYLLLILFFSFVSKGLCVCDKNSIIVGTERSGRLIGGKDEWNVEITNNCTCFQKSITLKCDGFQSVSPVDPRLFKKVADHCLLNQGRALPPFNSIKFSYAWYPPFFLIPQFSIVQC